TPSASTALITLVHPRTGTSAPSGFAGSALGSSLATPSASTALITPVHPRTGTSAPSGLGASSCVASAGQKLTSSAYCAPHFGQVLKWRPRPAFGTDGSLPLARRDGAPKASPP